MKKIAVSSLLSLFIFSCAVSVPDNGRIPHRDFRWSQYAPTGHPSLVQDTSSSSLQTPLLGGTGVGSSHSSLNFAELEKEYKSFSTKALSDAYVKRMFGKYLSPVNSVQLSRQLEFSRYLKNNGDTSYETSLKSMFAQTPSLYDTMTGTSAPDIQNKMTSDSANFGAYVIGLSPYPAAPVATGATNITSSSFTANWNPVSGATGYKLYVNGTEVYSGSNTSFNLTGLTSGSTYNYYVKSLNNAGTSSNSNMIGSVLLIPATPTDFVLVEGGTFQMGAVGIAEPVHNVTLSNYYIGKYEVKQSEWTSVYNNTTTALKGLMQNNPAPSHASGANLPVDQVSWWAAIAYCNAKSLAEGIPVAYDTSTGELLNASGNVTTNTTQVVGYRLSTEAEWEYASKGGNKTSFCGDHRCLYSGGDLPDSIGWYQSNSGGNSHDVGTKAANELGIYDMSGNLLEWNHDWSVDYTNSSVINPIGAQTGSTRVARGGYWNYIMMGSSDRAWDIPERIGGNFGFRVARSVIP